MTANHHLPIYSAFRIPPNSSFSRSWYSSFWTRYTARNSTVLHHGTPPLARNRICGPLQFGFPPNPIRVIQTCTPVPARENNSHSPPTRILQHANVPAIAKRGNSRFPAIRITSLFELELVCEHEELEIQFSISISSSRQRDTFRVPSNSSSLSCKRTSNFKTRYTLRFPPIRIPLRFLARQFLREIHSAFPSILVLHQASAPALAREDNPKYLPTGYNSRFAVPSSSSSPSSGQLTNSQLQLEKTIPIPLHLPFDFIAIPARDTLRVPSNSNSNSSWSHTNFSSRYTTHFALLHFQFAFPPDWSFSSHQLLLEIQLAIRCWRNSSSSTHLRSSAITIRVSLQFAFPPDWSSSSHLLLEIQLAIRVLHHVGGTAPHTCVPLQFQFAFPSNSRFPPIRVPPNWSSSCWRTSTSERDTIGNSNSSS